METKGEEEMPQGKAIFRPRNGRLFAWSSDYVSEQFPDSGMG